MAVFVVVAASKENQPNCNCSLVAASDCSTAVHTVCSLAESDALIGRQCVCIKPHCSVSKCVASITVTAFVLGCGVALMPCGPRND